MSAGWARQAIFDVPRVTIQPYFAGLLVLLVQSTGELAPVLSVPASCPPQQPLAETETVSRSCAILVAEIFDRAAPAYASSDSRVRDFPHRDWRSIHVE
jgi:hypothetical protein